MAKRYCPKCGADMYATGGGCNYRCPRCNYSFYEAPPRPNISRITSETRSAMREIESEMNRNSAEFNRSMRSMKEASRELERARKAEKERRKAQKKQGEKGISIGTIIGVIIVLWFFSQFF